MSVTGDKFFSPVYDNEYYSGAQTLAYIGDVFVDEIVTIEYNVVENRVPIRGYASRRFDKLTNGTVQVNGQFTINFKESGYLYAILERYHRLVGRKDLGPLASRRGVEGDDGQVRPLPGYEHEVMRYNIEQMLQLEKTPGNQQAKTEMAATIAGFLTRGEGKNPFDPVAESVFEEYENALWGPYAVGKQGDQDGVIDYSLNGGLNPEFQQYRKATDPRWGGFDMWITYGDYNGSDLKNHTVRKIIDIHFLGSQQSVDPSGNNIVESYLFTAKDIV